MLHHQNGWINTPAFKTDVSFFCWTLLICQHVLFVWFIKTAQKKCFDSIPSYYWPVFINYGDGLLRCVKKSVLCLSTKTLAISTYYKYSTLTRAVALRTIYAFQHMSRDTNLRWNADIITNGRGRVRVRYSFLDLFYYFNIIVHYKNNILRLYLAFFTSMISNAKIISIYNY